MVTLLAGCVGCHKPGAGYTSCSSCGLRFCPGCKSRLTGICVNCGSKLL